MNKNCFIIKKTIVENNTIKNYYELSGEWSRFFSKEREFMLEYSSLIKNVDLSISNIPIICNILPMVWVFDAELIVDEIDADFWYCISSLKKGYMDMYSEMKFRGKVTAKKIVPHKHLSASNVACMFSGGADAFHTMLSHIKESPDLISIWGADVDIDNVNAWSVVENHITNTASDYNLKSAFVKSSFRKMINEQELNEFVIPLAKDNWWHGFQHGIGILGHVAPYAYKYQIGKLYIASSFVEAQKGQYTCASDPTIDNYLRFCGCTVIHDGYSYTRQDKIQQICEFSRNNEYKPYLRVCWKSKTGRNCCSCEKCFRTILAIYAERQNPQDYGFEYSDKEFKKMISNFKYKLKSREKEVGVLRYAPIQKAMRKNYHPYEVDYRLKWFYDVHIEKINKTIYTRLATLVKKMSKNKI